MEMNKYIDHTLLKADATYDKIETLCAEAKEYDFASVCVNSYWVSACAELLKGTDVKVCTVVGFPLGAMSTKAKAFETAAAIADGAKEIDMVLNIGEMKAGHYDAVRADVKAVVEAAEGNCVKVILENYGFEVLDLGRDVPVETVVDTVREKDVHLVGLSALMTTTLKSMEETIAALHAAQLDCKIMVGGAVLTPEYAEKIGADWYAKDAKRSADIAKEFFGV